MSTQVDFYILAENSTEQAEHFACRLAEKAYRQGERLLILTENEHASKKLDDMLWTFRDDSFVPHTIDEHSTPITISHNTNSNIKLLINLRSQLLAQTENYGRILEIIAGDEQQRTIARDRYRQYQNMKCKINVYKLSGKKSHS